MKHVVLALSLLTTIPALAQPQEVTRLASAEANYSELKFKISTGGCNAANNQITYKLELVSKETQGTAEYSTVHVKAKLRIFEEGGGGCRMAYTIERTVDTEKLFKENAAAFGVKFDQPNTQISYEVILPPVISYGYVVPK
jgi:hypothetical protein